MSRRVRAGKSNSCSQTGKGGGREGSGVTSSAGRLGDGRGEGLDITLKQSQGNPPKGTLASLLFARTERRHRDVGSSVGHVVGLR